MVGTRQYLYESTLVDSVVESTWKFARCSHSAVNLKNADAGAGCRPPRARYATSCENWVQENPTKTDSQQPLAYRTSADFKARKDQWSNGGLHEIGFESDCQFGCSPKIQKHMFGFVYGCMRSK